MLEIHFEHVIRCSESASPQEEPGNGANRVLWQQGKFGFLKGELQVKISLS